MRFVGEVVDHPAEEVLTLVKEVIFDGGVFLVGAEGDELLDNF